MQKRIKEYLWILIYLIFGLSTVEASFFELRTTLDIGLNGAPKASFFALDTVDRYASNWRALQIPLENGSSYEQIHPFFQLDLKAAYENFLIHIEAPLRKDLEAWYQSKYSTNFTLSPSELDINVPNKAYAIWTNQSGFVQLGRFKPDLSPTPNTLAIGGAPHHDALLWRFEASIFRYDFLLSSLNPWLHGTPEKKGEAYPEGSEAYWQETRSMDNQRNRSYTEAHKNLAFHSLGVDLGFFWIRFMEQSVIGGRSLDLRSINPFMFWHDNYANGYTKASSFFEWGFRPQKSSQFYWQINLEDIASPVGESGGATTRSIISYLTGYRQEIKTASHGDFMYRLDLVYTDPAHNNQGLPLLKQSSRRMYRSNYRKQSDPDFADSYFVDYPLGYRRGPDALDIWLFGVWEQKSHRIQLEMAYLRQGDKDLYTDYELAIAADKGLSGIVETRYLVDVLYTQNYKPFLQFYFGGGFLWVKNREHIAQNSQKDFWIRSGLVFSHLFFKGKP